MLLGVGKHGVWVEKEKFSETEGEELSLWQGEQRISD